MRAGRTSLRIDLAKRLFDAYSASSRIAAITKEMVYADYAADEIRRLAVERLLEIVGEALTVALRIDPDLQDRYPDLRRAVGLRNRIIHGYDDINDEVIWDVVQRNIPLLATDLKRLLKDAPDLDEPS